MKNKLYLAFLILLTSYSLLLTGCIGGGFESVSQPSGKILVQPDVVYMKADGWSLSYSPNMPKNPINSSKGWHVDFPNKDGLHMILVPYHANKSHNNLIITYRITGTGSFISLDSCNGKATFQPMLERQGDTLTQEFYRWWGHPPVYLATDGQTHTVTFPLTPDHWSSVYGKFGTSAPAEFDASKKNLMAVGVVFGCFSAHGAYSTGKARFELLDYQIQ